MMKSCPSNHPPQLNDFCRICLLRKAQLRPLSAQTKPVMIPEMLYKLTGTMLNLNEQLPRVICEDCLTKLDLAYSVTEEFRRQEELLRSLWWKGALVDQLVAYSRTEGSRRKPHSEEIIERLAGERRKQVSVEQVEQQDQASVGSGLADLDEDFGADQEETILPVEQLVPLVKPESLGARGFEIKMLSDGQEEEPTDQFFDNGLEMVLELEDLQTIGALPAELLEQLAWYGIPEDEPTYSVTFIPSDSEYDQSDKDTDYVPDELDGQDDEFLLLSMRSELEPSGADESVELRDDESDASDPDLADDVADVDFHPDPARVIAKKVNGDCFILLEFYSSSFIVFSANIVTKRASLNVSVCRKVFLSRRTLYVHAKKHNARKEGQFSASLEEPKEQESDHQDNLEKGKGKFQCEHCQKSFQWLSVLKRHVQYHEQRRAAGFPVHKQRHEAGRYKCPICGKSFVRRNKLSDHVRRHKDVAHGRFACRICGHPCGKGSDQRRHERIHETDPVWRNVRDKIKQPIVVEKNDKVMYKCGDCQNVYASRLKYFQHAQKHIVPRASPYQCQDCGMRYMIKNNLRHHQRTVHKLFIKVEPDDEKEADVNTEPAPVDITKRLPHCGQCDAYFMNQLDYGLHMRAHEVLTHQESSPNGKSEDDQPTADPSKDTEECPLCNKPIEIEMMEQHIKAYDNVQP
ncbi:ZNF235 protein [Culex quinquefasciatus]|uniref:ZNF235 protein n=1 Tax=Culex quinquefasciatus TaxID=7176 RepID=B0WZG1_CULQU|nr:ZNF235 protein [Culex quinquefasciatus]|eukprot:XP_001862783.1 ZNF235 protein [Culex quinquefasciatus]